MTGKTPKVRIVFYGHDMDTKRWLFDLQSKLLNADIRVYKDGPTDWQAEYALVWQPPEQLFIQQRNLTAVINLGVGVDRLLKVRSLPEKIPLLKIKGAGMAELIFQYVLYGLLHFGRDFNRYQSLQRQKKWFPVNSAQLDANIIGIMGTGTIGRYVASQLTQLGYSVRSWGRSHKVIEGVDVFYGKDQLSGFAQGCHYLVNILPSTQDTYEIIDRELLNQLSDYAVLISCGRGEVINEQAVLDSLQTEKLKGALLDVFKEEPLSEHSPLWQFDNVIITPHIAAPTQVEAAVEQIIDYIHCLENGIPVVEVNRTLGY